MDCGALLRMHLLDEQHLGARGTVVAAPEQEHTGQHPREGLDRPSVRCDAHDLELGRSLDCLSTRGTIVQDIPNAQVTIGTTTGRDQACIDVIEARNQENPPTCLGSTTCHEHPSQWSIDAAIPCLGAGRARQLPPSW
jgi:hypothetical protein